MHMEPSTAGHRLRHSAASDLCQTPISHNPISRHRETSLGLVMAARQLVAAIDSKPRGGPPRRALAEDDTLGPRPPCKTWRAAGATLSAACPPALVPCACAGCSANCRRMVDEGRRGTRGQPLACDGGEQSQLDGETLSDVWMTGSHGPREPFPAPAHPPGGTTRCLRHTIFRRQHPQPSPGVVTALEGYLVAGGECLIVIAALQSVGLIDEMQGCYFGPVKVKVPSPLHTEQPSTQYCNCEPNCTASPFNRCHPCSTGDTVPNCHPLSPLLRPQSASQV